MLDAIISSNAPIPQELYLRYASNLRRAVEAVPIDNPELAAQWQASVARFSAYKSFCAAQAIREAVAEDGDMELATRVLHAFNRYQAAEYNTAVARARTGKQWLQFSEPDNIRLFPNLKWLPSRSATPREEHMPFYNRVWPKDDPFWNSNQPGTLWNCKCDWEQTDEDPTDDNPTTRIVKPGLKGNPAITGEIFSSDASYFNHFSGCSRSVRDHVESSCQFVEQIRLQSIASNFSGHCTACIGGTTQDIIFPDWGVRETAHAMHGKKSYWLKNECFNLQSIYSKAEYIGADPVDLTHNTRSKTIRLKKKFEQYHQLKTKLPDGQVVFIKIAEKKKEYGGEFCLYSITAKQSDYK